MFGWLRNIKRHAFRPEAVPQPNPLSRADQFHCTICGRILNVKADPMSADSGGDCWGCIGEIEAQMGHAMSDGFVKKEIVWGWREADGSPKSQAFFLANPSTGRTPLHLPDTDATPLIRTDFSSDEA